MIYIIDFITYIKLIRLYLQSSLNRLNLCIMSEVISVGFIGIATARVDIEQGW